MRTRSSSWTVSWKTRAQKMAAQEEKVRDFKDRYMGELPTRCRAICRSWAGCKASCRRKQDQLGRAKQHNVYLESLQNQYKTMGAVTARPGELAHLGLAALDQELAERKRRSWPI